MKITRVEPTISSVPFEHGGPKPMHSSGPRDNMHALLVRTETDRGIVGWGEVFGFSVSPVTLAAVQHLFAPQCMGADPELVPELMKTLRTSAASTKSLRRVVPAAMI